MCDPNRPLPPFMTCVLALIGMTTWFGLIEKTEASTYEGKIAQVDTKRIWDDAPHNAFTDLVEWNGKIYCAFREGKGHAGDIGKLRIIVTSDGDKWESAGLLDLDDYDLRDAALSVTPDNRLMVLGGAQQNLSTGRSTGTFVSFSEDGKSFTEPRIVVPLGRWLWRVTWHGDTAYGVAYGTPDDRGKSSLLKTKDGIHYETVTDELLTEGGWPTEARLRFDEQGNAYCFHRRDGTGNSAYLGVAKPPYKDWKWHDLGARIGGPNFIRSLDGGWIGSGRLYDGGARTELVELDAEGGTMKPFLRLPSGGDTSYPGMLWRDDTLWVSYYASHEGKTNIYLSKVRFDADAAANESAAEPIDIGSRRELFVDHHLIDRMENATLQMHAPRAAEKVLTFDRPWEGAFCGYITVIHDGDLLRMYYRGLPRAGGDGSSSEVTCYAQSRDGIHWEKPNLKIYEVDGTRDNNVILANHAPATHNFSPFKDTNPQAPASQRYKALGGTAKGLLAYASPDGINWKRIQEEPVFTKGVFDSQNVSFFSEAEQQYVCYFRTWTGSGYSGFRTVSRTTSEDFVHWTDPVEMTFGETPHEHLYTNQTSPYFRAPHISLGIAARFMPNRQVLTPEEAKRINVDHRYFRDCSDAVLLSTRGGSQYDRTFMESFVRPGLGLENWVSRTNYPALGIVPTGEEQISFYIQKNYGQPTAFLQRFTLRTDGFASLHAGYQPGEVITKPIVFDASKDTQLQLNYATSAAGSITVELQDVNGTAIPGFSLADCATLIGDGLEGVVRWKGDGKLEELAGKPIRLRFVLKDADVYSMQFK